MSDINSIKVNNTEYQIVPQWWEDNAGSHNSIFRGRDITKYFYGEETFNNKTFSEAVADGSFDNIFPGDYIIGQSSSKIYIVAGCDTRYQMGDTALTTHHVCLFNWANNWGGTTKFRMNSSNTTERRICRFRNVHNKYTDSKRHNISRLPR